MSDSEIKMSVVLPFGMEYYGEDDALDFFISHLEKEPEEIDSYDGGICYFQYKGEIRVVRERYDGKPYWGVEYVLLEGNLEDYPCVEVDYKKLDHAMRTLARKFFKPIIECKLICVTWYNGTDPPNVLKGIAESS